jgi:hypothetical protein
VIPVGGVLLAIAILILALNPPGEPRLPGRVPVASGALIARDQHPEWRQLLMLAALRRADELRRLRELPDTPVRTAPPEATPPAEKAPEVAAIPVDRGDAEPDDVTATAAQAPSASLPLDIGETSSTELPVMPHEEQPPVIKMPERRKPADESLNTAPEPAKPQPAKRARKVRHTQPAKQQAAVQFNLFEALFGAGAFNGSPIDTGQTIPH